MEASCRTLSKQVLVIIFATAPDSVFADSTCLLADDAVMKQQILLSEPATNLVLTSSNTVYITLIDSKQLCKLQLPNSDEKVISI